jgi:hypothetical protein
MALGHTAAQNKILTFGNNRDDWRKRSTPMSGPELLSGLSAQWR